MDAKPGAVRPERGKKSSAYQVNCLVSLESASDSVINVPDSLKNCTIYVTIVNSVSVNGDVTEEQLHSR